MVEPSEDANRADADPGAILERLRASLRRAGDEDEATGPRIGGYAVKGEIARGGMGVILRVRDADVRRDLAMKVLHAPGEELEGSRDAALESQRSARFLEEAQITGQLDHPGIVPVHELGLDRENRLYFTMRLVKGKTFDEVITLARERREGMTLTRALGIVQKVCEAMAFAHSRGVIHRDLKPANIMVGRFGETYVMDWGLAKILDDARDDGEPAAPQATILSSSRREEAAGDESSLSTLDGDVVGTPSYMAPEQALGRVSELGAGVDVYAVGAMLYHLLSGLPPYTVAGERTPALTVLQGVLEGPPRPLRELTMNIPDELVAIAEKAMRRDVSERYPDMLAMADDIQAFIENRVVSAYESGAVAEFKKWVGRNKGLAASLAAAILVGFAGLGAVAWVQARASQRLENKNFELLASNEQLDRARDEAVQNGLRARTNEALAKESEALALDKEREAIWQSYTANVVAANASLDLGAANAAADRLEACAPEHRGWEWRFLSNRADVSLAAFEASAESFVQVVAFDPRGRYVAAGTGNWGTLGGRDFSVVVFDLETGELVHRLEGHAAKLEGLAFSPSGTELVSGSEDGTVRVWDVESGDEIAVRRAIAGIVAIHPNGLSIAAGGANQPGASTGDLQIWDLLEDRIVFHIDALSGLPAPRSLVFSPDGERLAVGFVDETIRVYDAESERVLRKLDFTRAPGELEVFDYEGVVDVGFGPDESLIAACGREVRIFAPRGQASVALRGHGRTVTGAVFHPDGRRAVSSSLDGTLRIWDVESGQTLEVLQGHDDAVTSIAMGPDGHRVVSGSKDRTMRLWDGRPGSSVTTLQGAGGDNLIFYDVTFSPDGTRLAWKPDDRTVRITDARTGEDLVSFPTLVSPIRALRFLDDERVMTVGLLDHIRIWKAETGELLEAIGQPLPPVFGVDVAPGGDRIAGCTPFRLFVWDGRTGERLHALDIELVAKTVRFSHDGARVAAGALKQGVRVWDVETGEVLHDLALPAEAFDFAFSPSGELLVANTYDTWDASLYVFDVASGRELRVLKGHFQTSRIAFTPDGERLVSGGWDGTVSLWDPGRGELVSLGGHEHIVATLAVDPTGARLATAELGGIHRIWETVSVEQRGEPRRRSARRASLEQRLAARVELELERRILPEDAIAALRADAALTDEQKDVAERLVRRHPFLVTPVDATATLESVPAGRAFQLLMKPDRTPDDVLRALRTAERIGELTPRFVESRLYSLESFALLRMGRIDEARAQLEAVVESEGGLESRRLSLSPILLALCYIEDGRTDEARAIVARWRVFASSLTLSSDPGDNILRDVLRSLVQEAERSLADR